MQAIGGAIGGSLANFLLYSLDVVTVRLQVQRDTEIANVRKKPEFIKSKPGILGASELSIAQTFRLILQEEGWKAFFDGAGDDAIASFMQSFLYFFIYDYMRNRQIRYYIGKRGYAPRTLGLQKELFFGAVAGMFCKFFTTPLQNVVVLKQIDHTRSKSMVQCVKEIYKNKGITGLWSGYRATLFLSANPSLSYYFYQLMGSPQRVDSKRHVFVRAAIAKALATMVTYPVILAKTRTQARPGQSDLYRDLWKTYKNNGITGLYDGINAQLLKGCVSQGITMTTKESITRSIIYIYVHFLSRGKLYLTAST